MNRKQIESVQGLLRGKHYTEYVDVVKRLTREGDDEAAERLLLEILEVVEAEAAHGGHGVPPWYYERLAIIYRRRSDPMAEVAVLERYDAAPHAPGVGPAKLEQRLRKARELARLLEDSRTS